MGKTKEVKRTTRSRETAQFGEPTVPGTAPVQLNPHPHCRVTAEFLPVTTDTSFACSRMSPTLKRKEHALFNLLLLLSTMFLRFITLLLASIIRFFLSGIPLYGETRTGLPIHLLTFIWVIASVWLWWIKLLWTLECKSSLWILCHGIDWLYGLRYIPLGK